jgi:hypothetical protein
MSAILMSLVSTTEGPRPDYIVGKDDIADEHKEQGKWSDAVNSD